MRWAIAALLGTVVIAALALAAVPAQAEDGGVVWLCKPGMADNPCQIPQDTTIQGSGEADRVVTPAAGPGEIDCFYVYPTVSNQTTPNADKERDPELESIAKYQGARFSLRCRVFAPIYRQATLAAIGTGSVGASGADRELAYGDVLEAWRQYLAEENGGRGVVLIGHSQGTFMLRELLRREIEADREQLRLMVSALLVGGNVLVAEGQAIGGDFRRTPLCTREAQVACVVAFSTFAEDPSEDARFGVSGREGLEVACTDPRLLAGSERPLRVLTPSEPFAPGPIAAGIVVTSRGPPPSAPTTWVSPPDRFEGSCQRINGAHVLRLEPLPGSRRPAWFPDPSWGTHLIDVNVALDPLVALVARQAVRWTRPQLRLRRRCARGGLRVRLAGREVEFVRKAVFSLGRHRVGRDDEERLRATIGRRVLRSTRARRVKAVARLRSGGPERLVLEQRLPRCARLAGASPSRSGI
jgi:hypothetical protein